MTAPLEIPGQRGESTSAALRRAEAERDDLKAELAQEREIAGALAEDNVRLTADLAEARAAVRVVTVTPLAPPPPISVLKRWLCTTCNQHFGHSFDHSHGELTPVWITTTYRDL
jgi:hypothetical protein